jgi:DNA-binding GntR family transcriptional regulator
LRISANAIDRPNLSELIGEHIKSLIFEGTLASGVKIGEDEVARTMGTSRTPVKLALTELAKEGLVELIPRRGAFVKTFTFTDIIELYEIRCAIEGLAGRLAARHIDDSGLTKLSEMNHSFETYIDRLTGDDDHEAVIRRTKELDMMFHKTILEAAQNRHLEMMGLTSIEFLSFLYGNPSHPVETGRRTKTEHDEIIEALRSRSEQKAENLLQQHIMRAIEVLKEREQDE